MMTEEHIIYGNNTIELILEPFVLILIDLKLEIKLTVTFCICNQFHDVHLKDA